MYSANPRAAMNAYRGVGVESIVESASPHQLVLMLFDGARAAVALANASLQGHNIPAKCEAISKAIAIIDGGLKASLDLKVGGELAQNLSDLYAYMTQRLLHANLKNDLAALEEVSLLLQQLGSAWATLAATPVVAAPATPARPQGIATSYGTA
jgi:flagellar secretion chaperone FliS